MEAIYLLRDCMLGAYAALLGFDQSKPSEHRTYFPFSLHFRSTTVMNDSQIIERASQILEDRAKAYNSNVLEVTQPAEEWY